MPFAIKRLPTDDSIRLTFVPLRFVVVAAATLVLVAARRRVGAQLASTT
jgi:hypothetical protein